MSKPAAKVAASLRPKSPATPQKSDRVTAQERTAAGSISELTSNQGDFLAVTRAVADERRLQVLRLLQQESFGVLELCEMLQLAQPALSHHLKSLHGAGLLAKRREGNSIYYRRAPAATPLQSALFQAIDDLPLDHQVQTRLAAVQDQRRHQSEAFFASHANDFENQQARICNSSVYRAITLDMAQRHRHNSGRALEVGPGDGSLTLALAEQFEQVLAIDNSAEMLSQTAVTLGSVPNVTLRQQDFTKLGKRTKYDLVVACMVLHHLPSPASFFAHAHQLLRANGTLIIAELCPHDQQWAQSACGDLWLGFAPEDLSAWATSVNFRVEESQFLAQRNGFRIQVLALSRQQRRAHRR